MIVIILCLPFLGFLSGSILGGFISTINVCYVTSVFTGLAFLISVGILINILNSGNVLICKLFTWISINNMSVNWSFCVDSLTAIMLCVVTCISMLVHIYSIEYMENDPHRNRFMSYLSLFTFFMLILVTSNNFLQMFIGWEGVGVSSYLLINFWFTRLQANKAAIKAMLVNRVGDFGLLIALFTIFFVFNTFDYDIIFTLVPLKMQYCLICGGYQISIIDIICFFLIIGAMGKSAQIGLHTWLPDAMEGPTPVSALIHAATMVTAGIFLTARCSYLFEFSTFNLNFMTIVGIFTAFFAATTGLFQNDIKKVIAYSTCSQLGYMMCSCGLSGYEIGLFHLSNHAFFKALLFLGAGSIIHALGDEQDMRKMGGLQKLLPFSYATAMIGSLALTGFPFLAGFYSKDVILEVSVTQFTFISNLAWIFGLLVVFCTAFYSTRLFYLVFLTNTNGNKKIIINAHEGSWKMIGPLLFLAIFSIFIGFIAKDFFIGIGTDFWGPSLFINSFNYYLNEAEFLNIFYKLLPLFFTLLGMFTAYYIYSTKAKTFYQLKLTTVSKNLYLFFNKKWFFDRIYNVLISQTVLYNSFHFFYKQLDRGILEKIGPAGITLNFKILSDIFKYFQSGYVFNYVCWLILIIGYIICIIHYNVYIYSWFIIILITIF